jgi:glutamyl-tRNA synthetase
MTIITRFAPSPTGLLHIGGARTALFNYLFAKRNSGKFLLRIEDTDKKRSTNEAKNAILEGLNWLGIKHDDSIFYQSQNEKRHQEIAYRLLEEGKAYYCYTSSEELILLREEAQKQGKIHRFQSPWRDKNLENDSDIKPVIRIKSPTSGYSIIEDQVQCEVKVDNAELDDFIILRNDGTPTYNLAVVVDDFDMGVTHIIRGDDHLNNSFRQKIIYDLMGWELPIMSHIPLIHGSDGAKMSKRHGATSVIEYKNMGYLPQAIRNYLLRLGWSSGDKETISDKEAIDLFDLSGIGKSPSRFDFAKLNNLNKHYLKSSKNEDLLDLINFEYELEEKIKFLQAIEFIKERATNLNDIENVIKIYKNNFYQELEEKEQNIIQNNKDLIKDIRDLISKINNWNIDSLKEEILNYAQEKGLKMKHFGPTLRIILTFSSSSAGGIFEILEILGKEEVLKRFSNY